MARHEFTKRTKIEAFTRCGGKCEECGTLLRPGRFQYDHSNPDAFSSDASLDNCRVLCVGCHAEKTFTRDIPEIAKSNRIRARRAGIKKPSKFACSRQSRFKKKIDGTVVIR